MGSQGGTMGTPWVGSLSLLGLMGPQGLVAPQGLMGPQGFQGTWFDDTQASAYPRTTGHEANHPEFPPPPGTPSRAPETSIEP